MFRNTCLILISVWNYPFYFNTCFGIHGGLRCVRGFFCWLLWHFWSTTLLAWFLGLSSTIPTNQINNNQPTNYPCLILIPVLEYFFDFNACLILIPVSKYLFDFHFSFINRNICLIFIPVSKYLFDLHTLIEIPAWFWYLFDIDTCFEIYLFDFYTFLILIPVSKYLFDLHTLIEITAWFWYLFDIDTCFEIPIWFSYLFDIDTFLKCLFDFHTRLILIPVSKYLPIWFSYLI